MEQRIEKLLRRFDAAEQVAIMWRSKLRTAYQYIIPDRDSFTMPTPGQQLDVHVFDSTAVLAAVSLSSKLHSTLTPPFIKWADLVSGTEIEDGQKKQVDELLQQITNILFKYIDASNFSLAVNEAYLDLTIGTAVLRIDEGTDDKPFNFSAVPLSEMAFEEDINGTLDNCFWKRNIAIEKIQELWPKAKLPQVLRQMLENDKLKKVTIKEMVIVNNIDKDTKEYTYTVIETIDNTIIYEDKSPSNCFIPFRWSKLAGDTFGRGPGIRVLKSVKTLNLMVEYELAGAALNLAPPFLSNNNSEINTNNFRVRPNTLIQVNNAIPGIKALEPLMTNPNVQLSEYLCGKLEEQINKAFYTNPLGPIDSPAKTATEITIRQQQLLEEIGPAFGRLEAEFLVRVIERCIYILVKKGLIPGMKVDGKLIAIKYRSPLARSQAQADVLSFTQMYETLVSIVGQELAILSINPEQLPQWLSEKFGVDMKLIKSPFDLEMIRQQIQQVAMAQLANQQPMQEAA